MICKKFSHLIGIADLKIGKNFLGGCFLNDEIFLIQLRDCFTAGYTLPQFCIDNNIKKPLIIAPNANYVTFLWEVYIQFHYDKRMSVEFALLEGKIDSVNFSYATIANGLKIKNISELAGKNFDRVIFLTTQKFNIAPANFSIYLDWLANYFIQHTYADIPLLNFVNRHAGVKLFTMGFPCDYLMKLAWIC